MTDTTVAAGLRVQQWDRNAYREFLEDNIFEDWMDEGPGSIIQIKEDLTKKKGDSVTYALINRLKGAGVTGSDFLEGAEEAADTRSLRVFINKHRNAVRTSEMEEQKSAIDLRNNFGPLLKDWMMESHRDRFIDALGSINGVLYSLATENQKDAWLTDNSDRVQFGKLRSNNSSNDHSASLANIDTTNDLLTSNLLELMKSMARAADPKIRPIRVEGDRHFYVVIAGSNPFRDLGADTRIVAAQQATSINAQNNRLWKGGDIEWKGMVVREVPDLPIYTNVGNGGNTNVSPVYLLGAQALAYAVGRRPKTIDKTFDYEDKKGLAIDVIDGVAKMIFGDGAADTDDLKDHGVVTAYVADVANA